LQFFLVQYLIFFKLTASKFINVLELVLGCSELEEVLRDDIKYLDPNTGDEVEEDEDEQEHLKHFHSEFKSLVYLKITDHTT